MNYTGDKYWQHRNMSGKNALAAVNVFACRVVAPGNTGFVCVSSVQPSGLHYRIVIQKPTLSPHGTMMQPIKSSLTSGMACCNLYQSRWLVSWKTLSPWPQAPCEATDVTISASFRKGLFLFGLTDNSVPGAQASSLGRYTVAGDSRQAGNRKRIYPRCGQAGRVARDLNERFEQRPKTPKTYTVQSGSHAPKEHGEVCGLVQTIGTGGLYPSALNGSGSLSLKPEGGWGYAFPSNKPQNQTGELCHG